MARGLGAPQTVVLLGVVVAAGAIWFASQLPAMSLAMLPVYQRIGIVPANPEPAVDEIGKI